MDPAHGYQVLHGSSGPDFNPHEYYIFRNGQMHNGIVAVRLGFGRIARLEINIPNLFENLTQRG